MAHGLTANLTNISDRGLAAAYMAGMASANAPLSRLAMVIPWGSTSYDAAMYKPPSTYSSGTEGADISTEAVEEQSNKSITVSVHSLGYACSDLARLTLPREVLVGLFKVLGNLGIRFFEKELGALFNNATGTTTTADGVSWSNDTHTSSAGNQDNKISGNLSFANYQTAVQMLMDQLDDRGNVMGGLADLLIVPTDERVLANQIRTATHDADNRSTPNVDAGGFGVMVSPDLTSATQWTVFAEQQFKLAGIKVPVVRGPNPWVIEREEKSLRYEVRDKIYAGFGVVDWRGSVFGT